jgi:hypothetical protein
VQPVSRSLGVAATGDFPLAQWEALQRDIHERVHRDTHSLALDESVAGCSAIFFRFAMASDFDESYRSSIDRAGTTPVPDERYIQELSLFGFFVSGCSAVESLVYVLFSLASVVYAADFSLSDEHERRNVSIKNLTARFQQLFPNDQITAFLEAIMVDLNLNEMIALRNIIVHRSVLRRRHFAGGDRDGQTVAVSADRELLELNMATTLHKRMWLSQTLTQGISETDGFLRAHVHLPAP